MGNHTLWTKMLHHNVTRKMAIGKAHLTDSYQMPYIHLLTLVRAVRNLPHALPLSAQQLLTRIRLTGTLVESGLKGDHTLRIILWLGVGGSLVFWISSFVCVTIVGGVSVCTA